MSRPAWSSHVWTGRAPRPTVTQRVRMLLALPGTRVALATTVPALVLATALAPIASGTSAAADDVVVAAAQPGGPGAGVAADEAAPTARLDDHSVPAPAGPARMAAVDGVNLFVTSSDATIVGFHEAAFPTALSLLPVGRALAFDNGRVGHLESTGPNFVVMSSRGRGNGPTTAVDVAQEPGASVVAAVTGTVTDVQRYSLYGRYPDTRIEIAPTGRPDLRVVMLHVADATVAPGAPVEAGRTQVARTATQFPFTSHVDRYAGGRPPHVHVEVKRV